MSKHKSHSTFYIGKFLSLLALGCSLLPARAAEPPCRLEHYSTADGLPQYTIMSILQDKKGFMWFGTWDGLSRFDGYTFRNFKVQPGDAYDMRSNRLERLWEDPYGNIYIRSYDGEAHCFNPGTQAFQSVYPVEGIGNSGFLLNDVEVKPSGKTWLLSEENGCICVYDSLFSRRTFNRPLGNLKAGFVHSVLEEREGSTWLLTDNGLTWLSNKLDQSKHYFYDSSGEQHKGKQKFFYGVETPEFLMFCSVEGRIWKFTKKTKEFVLIQLEATSNVIRIHEQPGGTFLAVTKNDGLFRFNSHTGQSMHLEPKGVSFGPETNLSSTYLDRRNQLWITTNELGIYKINLNTLGMRRYLIDTEDETMASFPPRRIVLEDKNGRLWVQPRGGGFSLYNPSTDELESFFNDQKKDNWKFSNLAHTALSDRQGNLWISTRSNGLEKAVFDRNFFQTKRIDASAHAVVANDVRCLLEDKYGRIFVSTKDRRITVYDPEMRVLGRLSPGGELKPDALLNGVVYCMMQDKQGTLWLGTKGFGIYRMKPAGEGRWTGEQYRFDPTDVYSLSDDKVYSLYQDSQGRIWAGTYDGGINLIQETPDGKLRFLSFRNNLRTYPSELAGRVRFITEDKKGHICLGTTEGLVLFPAKFSNPEKIQYRSYSRIAGNRESLSGNDVHSICVTQSGEMIVLTFGGGINRVTAFDSKGYPKSFQSLTRQDGLPSDVFLSILEDQSGMVWASSENDMVRLNPKTMVFETFAEIKRMMKSYSFSEGTAFKLRSGKFLFGYSGGIVSFFPQKIHNNNHRPYLAFTDFLLFNKRAEVRESSPFSTDIDYQKKIKLKHNQNFFSIEFAALDFQEPGNIRYAYILDGFDKDWQYTSEYRVANYTNIPKGKYVFRVKSTNSEGVWVENERQLVIVVKPSIWDTWFAYILYLLLTLGLIVLCARILMTIYKLRNDVEIEKKVSDMKLRFFTDVSHEIRTPLTMITAPVEYLLNDSKTPEDIRRKMSLISHNTTRMLRLVNQILDFRKMQDQQLRVSEVDLGSFAGEICSDFTDMAQEKKMKFEFINLAAGEKIWIDPNCLEKMIMNLLSNAFKYTPDGKSIRVTVRKEADTVLLQVADSGPGIPQEMKRILFTRFASLNSDKSKPSTGIGLSMVKELAEKHDAKVTVDSEPGKGSTFTIAFRTGFSHLTDRAEILLNEPKEANAAKESETKASGEVGKKQKNAPEKTEPDKYSLLIVEDDKELREFMKSILETEYQVLEAENGLQALVVIGQTPPDFIVSDIMMPEMDGIELLKAMRENIETSHIPVILLTAKANIESKLEGLSVGADDYITKPFSVPYFQARIVNLIKQRKRLQEIYSSGLSSGVPSFDPKPFMVTSQDEVLMQNVVQSIENNMDNSDFTVEDLGQSVGMSRSSFFNKVKSLTGLSPVEFIRDIRLKRAAQLLTTGELLIKEVAFMTGFSDARYFGECFKNKYGMTPAEFKKRNAAG